MGNAIETMPVAPTEAEPTAPPPVNQPQAPPAEDWRKLHAFGLPGGSIRAILAVMIFGAIWTWLLLRPQSEVPEYLQNLMFIIMGHYFASRAKADAAGGGPEPGPPPLYLPRGTVRFVLVLGFAGVFGTLLYQHRLWLRDQSAALPRLTQGGVTLILVAGFLLGVVLGRVRQWQANRGHKAPRIVEDVRAAVSLVAAGLLLVLLFGFWSVPDKGVLHDVQRFFVKYRVEDVLAAVVGFYFGSRS